MEQYSPLLLSVQRIVKTVLLFLTCSSSFAQTHTELNGIKTSVIRNLSAAGTQARQFEVASVGYNSYHWQEGGIIIAELFSTSYQNDYKKYSIEIGYGQGGQGAPELKLIESLGRTNSSNSRIVLGNPSDLNSQHNKKVNRQIPIYVDVREYSHYNLRLTYQQTRVSTITSFDQIKINESPTATNITDFSVKGITYAIANGNLGIGTTNPQRTLDVNGVIGTNGLYINKDITSGASDITYPGNTLRILSPQNSNTHNLISLYPGTWGGNNDVRVTIMDMYTSRGLSNYSKKVQIHTNGTTFFNGGNVGIGVENPTTKLDVAGDIKSHNLILGENARITRTLTDNFTYDNKSVGHYSMQWNWDSWSQGGPALYLTAFGGIKFFTEGGYRMGINAIGNVGIGVENPINKLEVDGTIRATEVKVETGWADFVFAEGYKLRSLDDVKAHIEEHKHLPDIPSEAEIKENGGVALGDMQVKLLQKIEELTLYVIDLKEEIEQLKEEKTRE